MAEKISEQIAKVMKQQIRALSEHVDNLTYRTIKIEERLEKSERELKRK